MRRLFAAAMVVLAIVFGYPAQADVLIGLAGPITGKQAWYGEQMQRGAELAVADINAAGGVLGQQVRLIAETIPATLSKRWRPPETWLVRV